MLSMLACIIVTKLTGAGNVKSLILGLMGGGATFALLVWLLTRRRSKSFNLVQYLVLFGLTTLSATLVIFALAQIPVW